MKLIVTLNASYALNSNEGFAGMLRLVADTIEQTPCIAIDSVLYDAAMTRCGHLTFVGAAVASSDLH